jgi:thioredoxin-like negative regulator of GroEL
MKILKFYSEYCGPCKVMDANLKKLNIDFVPVDINDEDNDALIEKYKIRNIPTIVKEKDGIEIARFTGVMSIDKLKEWCDD